MLGIFVEYQFDLIEFGMKDEFKSLNSKEFLNFFLVV
jgi:hypothetical protein